MPAQPGPLHGPAIALPARRGAGAAAAVDVDDVAVAQRRQVVDGQPGADRLVGHHAVDALGSHAAPDHDDRHRRGQVGDGPGGEPGADAG